VTGVVNARLAALSVGAVSTVLGVAVLGAVIAVTGAGFGCVAGVSEGVELLPSSGARQAVSQIPATRLRLYRGAARRFDLDWAFLASVGAQECHHGTCAGDNGSGCAGPMQIAVRRNSPCSPGGGPTLWDRYGVDADHDGRRDPDNPADAIYTAARILRQAKGAPPAGGSHSEYRRAACAYYGACGDATAHYADEVMARAVTYGFGDDDSGPALAPQAGCGSSSARSEVSRLGSAVRERGSGGLVPLPMSITGGTRIECDRRVRSDVVALARRFRVRVTACFAIGHASDGEHPLGAAVDLVPDPDVAWTSSTERLAREAGWMTSCAASGVAPACARPPFRFIGYNGFPDHGDPTHCQPCAGGAHLHLSWLTSASAGEQENASRTSYFPPSWVDVLGSRHGSRRGSSHGSRHGSHRGSQASGVETALSPYAAKGFAIRKMPTSTPERG
jgi:hypothetical protein